MTLFSFIKSNLSILDVASEYVQLKPAGNYFKGSCPFHAEKDASFTVSPDKGIFYCFGCHTGGDVISFIAKSENLSPLESAQHLVDRFKIKIPKSLERDFSDVSSGDDKKRHIAVCEAISDWINKQLLSRKEALKYLTDRSINKDEIDYFKLGYFPGGFRSIDFFIKDMQRHNILLAEILETGFLAQGTGSIYSPFEERIIFPIRDILGRGVGFGGRIFHKEDKRAKYYNSRDAILFQKGHLLFGLDLAKQEMKNKGFAFLVEGYTDCVAMVKHGYKNVVATLGTACTQEHLKLLSRYIKTLYVLYDGDSAGQKAILRMVELCWNVNLDLKIVHFSKKEDPDSFLSRGESLQPLIDRSNDIFEFFVDSVGSTFAVKSLSEKLELGKKIISLIVRIEDQFKRDLLLQHASVVMQVPISSLKEFLADESEKLGRESHEYYKTANIDKKLIKSTYLEEISHLEKKILFAIINDVDKNQVDYVIKEDILPYFSEHIRFFLGKLDAVWSLQPENRFTSFFDNLNEQQQAWISCNCLKFNQNMGDGLFSQLVFQFRKQRWKSIVKETKQEILKAKKEKDYDKFQELTEKFFKIKQEMKGKGIL